MKYFCEHLIQYISYLNTALKSHPLVEWMTFYSALSAGKSQCPLPTKVVFRLANQTALHASQFDKWYELCSAIHEYSQGRPRIYSCGELSISNIRKTALLLWFSQAKLSFLFMHAFQKRVSNRLLQCQFPQCQSFLPKPLPHWDLKMPGAWGRDGYSSHQDTKAPAGR